MEKTVILDLYNPTNKIKTQAILIMDYDEDIKRWSFSMTDDFFNDLWHVLKDSHVQSCTVG